MQIKLPPHLAAFVAANSGEGTHFSTPDEFVAAVIQEKRERLEAAARNPLVKASGEVIRPPHPTGYLNAAE